MRPVAIPDLGLLLVLTTVALAHPAGQAVRDDWSAADAAWLDDRAAAFRADRNIPGLSIALAVAGRQVYARGFGSASLDGTKPISAETRFRTASVTKSFTAVAIMRLVDQQRIVLDEPARRYCTGYPARPRDPTVRDLLAHRSGLPHTTDEEDTSIAGDYSRLADAVPLFADKPLAFTPGTDTLYSSWGYALLGCVIEGVTGQTYWEAMTELVFRPARLTSVVRDTPSFSAPDFTPGFRPGRLYGLRPSVVVDTRFKTPASGLIASAPDLVRFGLALGGDGLLTGASRRTMLTPEAPDAPAGSHVLGWQVAAPRPGGRPVYQTGSMEGTTALLFVVPERGNVFAILVNRERYVQETVPLFQAVAERLRAN